MKKIIGALAIAAIVGGGTYMASTAQAAGASNTSSMRQQLTDAQKQILSQIKTLRDAGKDTEAEALAKANGLDKGFKNRPKPNAMQIQAMSSIKSAIDANDFAAFTTAIAGTPAAGKVDQATFSEIVNIRSLRKQAETAEKTFATNHQDLMGLIGPGKGMEMGHGPKMGKGHSKDKNKDATITTSTTN